MKHRTTTGVNRRSGELIARGKPGVARAGASREIDRAGGRRVTRIGLPRSLGFVSVATGTLALALLIVASPGPVLAQQQEWPVHSMDRPAPPVVDPGPYVGPRPPPSDAIVLFDGSSLDDWRSGQNAARWRVVDGAMEVVAGTGSLRTAREFGDVQLHIEWMAPTPAEGEGQDRANSGVYFMGRYELQVLDSYRSATYADGQAGALYGQHPPMVNASRAPGQWQTYDVVFRRPHFNEDGTVREPARMTVFHNGVLVHDNAVMQGATVHMRRATYQAHGDAGPIQLQDHGAPVRFRNVWVRELGR
jgi:hypothetical protein